MGEVISKNGVINPLHKRQDATQSCNSMNSQSSAQTVCTPALSPSLNSSVCENHTQVHLPLNIVTRVGCSPSVTNGMNSANSLSSCSGLSDCSAVTPPSSPQSQGSIAPVCTSSHQVGLPPANSQKPYSVDNGRLCDTYHILCTKILIYDRGGSLNKRLRNLAPESHKQPSCNMQSYWWNLFAVNKSVMWL